MSEQYDYNRRHSDRNRDSGVRKEIIEQMSEIEDPQYRVLLALILRQQDETSAELGDLRNMMREFMRDIKQSLGSIQRTDDQIKSIALNGHTDKHGTHHSWIDQQMAMDAHCGLIVGAHGEDGLCEHARQLIEDAKVAKVRRWKIMDGIAEKGVWLLLMFVGGLVVSKLFPGVFQ